MNVFYLIFTLSVLPLVSILSAAEYKEPQPELLGVDMTEVKLDAEEKKTIADRLADSCGYFDEASEASREYCYRALRLAMLIDKKNKKAVVANALLEEDRVSVTEKEDRKMLSEDMIPMIKKLQKKSSPDGIKLAGYLLVLSMMLEPDNHDLIYEKVLYKKKHDEMPWGEFKRSEDVVVKPILTDDSGDKREYSNDRLKQTKMKGLLVIKLKNGKYAGAVSQMNTTAFAVEENSFTIRFNQNVGEMMEASTKEVMKFTELRYDLSFVNSVLEFSFADKHSPKDGPSAAVAMTLMTDSILSGKELDQGLAITGDMTAVGGVQPVGAVPSKVKAAIRKECTHVGIPSKNERDIEDHCLLDGLSTLYEIQIFSISEFEQAAAIGYAEKSSETEEAMAEFGMVMKALKKNPKYLYNAKVKEKLVRVTELMPNHFSAGLLLRHATKKMTKKLSVGGSMDAIDEVYTELLELSDSKGIDPDAIYQFSKSLRKIKRVMDHRVRYYYDSVYELADASLAYMKALKQATAKDRSEAAKAVNKARSDVKNHRENLLKDPDVVGEIIE